MLTYLGHEYDLGVSMVEQAVGLNPNLAIVWYSRGWISLMCDETERAIESFDRMIRLSPLDPLRAAPGAPGRADGRRADRRAAAAWRVG